jgi:DNA-binding MarR family transcriptional regulator
MTSNLSADFDLPDWLPDPVRLYLSHTGIGIPFRELARRQGAHASTVMRQVRRCEARREDPLVDEALARLGGRSIGPANKEDPNMTAAMRPQAVDPTQHPLKLDEITLAREGRRVLRRLAEPGAVLAVAGDLEKAVILREFPDGQQARTGVVDRAVAQAFALKDWISCRKKGRVTTYEITTAGRAALKRLIDEADVARHAHQAGLAEAPMPFANQHRVWDERQIEESGTQRRIRYNIAESPIAVLGRRRDKDGKPFLENDLIRAAERLREDFELAQMGPRVAQNWERFMTPGDRGAFRPDAGHGEGPARARDRVAAALRDLGPGLGDVALRVCCFLEGIETAEKRMGWAARSGKVVLRIALQRLRRHYDEAAGEQRNYIG